MVFQRFYYDFYGMCEQDYRISKIIWNKHNCLHHAVSPVKDGDSIFDM